MDTERKQSAKRRALSPKRPKSNLDSHGSSEEEDSEDVPPQEQPTFDVKVKKEPLEPNTTGENIAIDTSLVVTSSSETASPPPVAAPSASASPPPSTPLASSSTSPMPPPALTSMPSVSPLLAPPKISAAIALAVPETQPTTKRKRGRPRMYDKPPVGNPVATRPVAIAPAPLPAIAAPPTSIVVPGGPRRKWTKLAKHTTKTILPLATATSGLPTLTVPPPQSQSQLHSPHQHLHHLPPTPDHSPFLPSPSHTAEIPLTLRPTIIPTYVASTTHALVSPVTSPHPITHTLLLIDADLFPDLVPLLDRPVPGTQSFIFASPRSRPALVAHPPLFPPPTYATLFRTSRDAENAAGFELVRHAFQWLYAGLVTGKKVYVCGDEGDVGNLVEVLREHRIVAEGVKTETIKEIMAAV